MEKVNTVLLEKTKELKNKHDMLKAEMLNILEASRILNEQYKILEDKLYMVEDEYVEIMQKIIK
jgi:uncharacterized protein (DUF342 family)